MQKAFKQLREFHEVYDIHRQDRPSLPPSQIRALRRDILKEEYEEYEKAEDEDNLVEIADALADIIYVAVGTCVAYGIPIDRIFEEVHASNMSKLDQNGKPIYRADGKVLKGPNYFPPDISALLNSVVDKAVEDLTDKN